ncbi:hypothetical protein B9G53_04445 [Pseudanabaena sp. SR411]|uniref:hypothetical protein n=1 Tax=Pseudanabaena sp. SR411 TaxID=1980935 RepID=UPI000B983BCF|nr:hypothetical protein [Pseudanabaena sp. SR411]OYQ66247.1 hypothetical protein B9G53_04445 [Pseudanabaena sp. SR411]
MTNSNYETDFRVSIAAGYGNSKISFDESLLKQTFIKTDFYNENYWENPKFGFGTGITEIIAV